jgi:cell division protein FtsN
LAGSAAVVGASIYGISVGEFTSETRANSERARITEATKLNTRVVTVTQDTVSVYRVVVGSFVDRTEAERTASDLIQRGVVNEARVVPTTHTASGRP